MTPTFRESDLGSQKTQILKSCVSYQITEGHGHGRPSFFWYDNDKDLKVSFFAMCVLYTYFETVMRVSVSSLIFLITLPSFPMMRPQNLSSASIFKVMSLQLRLDDGWNGINLWVRYWEISKLSVAIWPCFARKMFVVCIS